MLLWARNSRVTRARWEGALASWSSQFPNCRPRWWPSTLRVGHPGHADEALDNLQQGALFVRGVRSLGTNFAATRSMFKSHVRIVCTVPYDTLTIAAMSLMVLRRSSCTSHRIVSTSLGVELVEVRPDLSSSSSEVLPLLKRACHSKHLARLMASFPYARRIISKVSALELPSFTQNWMFAVCSNFTSMLKSQMWRHTWWQTLVLCSSQCSHSDATRHTEWRRSLLPSTAHAFTYCHRLAVYGTSHETFWYTYV